MAHFNRLYNLKGHGGARNTYFHSSKQFGICNVVSLRKS